MTPDTFDSDDWFFLSECDLRISFVWSYYIDYSPCVCLLAVCAIRLAVLCSHVIRDWTWFSCMALLPLRFSCLIHFLTRSRHVSTDYAYWFCIVWCACFCDINGFITAYGLLYQMITRVSCEIWLCTLLLVFSILLLVLSLWYLGGCHGESEDLSVSDIDPQASTGHSLAISDSG